MIKIKQNQKYRKQVVKKKLLVKIRLWNNNKIKNTKQNKTTPKIQKTVKQTIAKLDKTASKTTNFKTKWVCNVQNHINIRQQQKKEMAINIGTNIKELKRRLLSVHWCSGKFDHQTFFLIDDVFAIVTLHVLHVSIMLRTIILRDKITIKKKLFKNNKYKLSKQQAV